MEFSEAINYALGLAREAKDLTVVQVCLRGLIVFVSALIMIRVADKRFMSKMTAFDVLLGFILASSLARAVNGSAAFFPTLIMGFVIVLFHRLIALLTMRFERLGKLVKGEPDVLIDNGHVNHRAMATNAITQADLYEAARENAQLEDLEEIKKAVIERSGRISILPKE